MKRLNSREINDKIIELMTDRVQVRWDRLPYIYELVGHDCVTLDISPVFINIAKSYKEAKKSGALPESLRIYKIDHASSRKTAQYINPLY